MRESTPKSELETQLGFAIADIDEELTISEIEEMNRSIAKLREYTTPRPTGQDTLYLIKEVQKSVSNQPCFRAQMERHTNPQSFLRLLQLIRRQISIFETPFWFVSATIIFLGSYLVLQLLGSSDVEPFLLVSPVVVVGGVAYAFRGMGERGNELEDTVTIGWQQIALARMVIIVGFNNLMSLPFIVIAHRVHPGVPVLYMLVSWLAPLAIWASIALWASLYFGTMSGISGALLLWISQFIFRHYSPKLDFLTVATTRSEFWTRIIVGLVALFFTGLLIKKSNGRSVRLSAGG